MSAVLIIRDPDPERRRQGVAAATLAIRRLDLVTSTMEHGPVTVVWGTFPGGPVSRAPNAFVMGDVIPGPGPERLSAAEYAERLARADTPPAFDGIYFAATFDARGALTVAVDFLGAFPAYHARAGEALLVGTSPALITSYPGFTAAVDPQGLAALLITNGAVRGRTPYRGIFRLAAGHVLLAAPHEPPREVRHYALEVNESSHDVPAAECTLRLHEALVEASRRHVPADVPHTVLLSGGIDSRVIIGVLHQQGVPLNAITRGNPNDLEYRCARAVARHLKLQHHLVPHTDATFEQFERSLWWEGMACGLGSAQHGLGEPLPHSHPHLVAGYMADPVLGGVTVGKAFDRDTRTASFEYYLKRTNAWGVPLDVLPRLMRKDIFGDSAQVIVAQLREDFVNAADYDLARAWLHNMELRERFGMGQMCGRLTFRSWPRFPQNDRALMRVATGIPLSLLGGRHLEREMLKRFHTGLARQPLDRNNFDTTPLLAGVMDLVRAGIDRRIRRFRSQLGMPRPERRYYHRAYDFNGSAWRTMRRAAEADRERAYELFDRETFDSLVPGPDEHFAYAGAIENAAGPKMLTGLAAWLRVGVG